MGFDMNYKIKVANEVESKEAQELFFELGFNRRGKILTNKILRDEGYESNYVIGFLYADSLGYVSCSNSVSGDFFNSRPEKEITLPELRDLVVLKRNDLKDANVSEDSCLYDLYLTESKELYFYHCGKKEWILSNLNGDDDYYKLLKPIEKKEMKEYLEKQTNGSYVMKSGFALAPADWIEIPEGSVKAYLNRSGTINFVNADDDYMNGVTHGEWVDTHRGRHESSGHQLVWQRESPNDKLASAEQYRQAEVLPFIDDEPKNVEQGSIEQTLAQRQSQYGCFEDVAFVTQGMIELMRKCNYDKMPASHQMALSMICSKMARIVNGDFNHKDSWHDIGGYAKLIEDEIFDETEMPF